MTFPPVGVTAVIAGMAVFNRDAAIVENRLRSIGRATTQLEAQSVAGMGAAAAAFTGMANAVTAASVVVAGAAVFAGAAAIKFAADFEQGMALTQALTGATNDQMDRLETTILDMTRSGTLGMGDLNKAAQELARAGVPIEDVLNGALKAVQDLTIASGGEIGLEKAAKLTATAMNAFGLTVDEVERVTTAATVVAQNSALTFTDFGTAVQYAGATFQAAGFTIEDLAVAEALLGKNGITASVAATSLRGVIQRLIRPSAAAKKVMEEYNISLFDSEGRAVGFDEVMRQLNAAFSDQAVAEGRLTEEQRLHAVSTLGLQRTGAAFLILANTTREELEELRGSFERLKITELVERQLNTFNSQLTIAKNNVLASAYAFGEVFLPALTDTLKGLNAFLKGMDLEVFRQAGRDILAFGGVIKEQIAGAIQTVRDFSDAFGLAAPAAELLKAALIGIGAIIATVLVVNILSAVAAFAAFAAVAAAIGLALQAVAGPVTEFVGTLEGRVGGVLVAIGEKLDELGAAWAPWAEEAGAAGTAVGSALSAVHGVVEALQFIMQGNFVAAAQSAQGAMGSFGTAATGALEAIQPLFAAISNAAGFLLAHTEIVLGIAVAYGTLRAAMAVSGVITGVASAWGFLTATIATSGGVIAGIVAILGGPLTIAIVGIAVVVGLLVAAWVGNWGDIQGKTQAVVEFVTNLISTFVLHITSYFTTLVSQVQGIWEALTAITFAIWASIPLKIKEDVTAIVEGVVEILSLLPAIAANLWQDFINAATQILAPGIAAIQLLVEMLKSAILQILANLVAECVEPATEFVTQVGNAITTQAGYAVDAARNLAVSIVSGFVGGILNKVGEIASAARSMVETALNAARSAAQAHSPSKLTQELGEDLDEGMELGIEEGAYDVVAAAEQVVADLEMTLVTKLENAKRPVRGTAASLVDELINELYSIQGRMDQLGIDMQAKMTQIGEEVGRKINEAIIDAAQAIEKTIADANERIAEMQENLGQSRADRERRDALSRDQEARRKARKEQQEDEDAAADHVKDLANEAEKYQTAKDKAIAKSKHELGQTDAALKEAELKFLQSNQDAAAKSEYEKAKKAIETRRKTIADTLADNLAAAEEAHKQDVARIEKQFQIEEEARLARRQRQHEDAEFERALEEETRQLTDTLEEEALARAIARTEKERDARITSINQALEEKQRKIREQGEREVKELHENTMRKIDILEQEFAKKAADVLRKGGEDMRPLVDNIQNILSGNFDAMRSSAKDFTQSVNDAIYALERLEAARKAAEFAAPMLPSPVAGLGDEYVIEPADIPSFQRGGVVPGPYGKPLLAIVHGGEFIAGLHSEAAKWLRQMERIQPNPGDTYNLNLNPNYSTYESPANIELDMRALIALAKG